MFMGTNVDCQQELVDYGIHNEASNIRAHVAPLAAIIFVFPTCGVINIMRKFQKKPAFQTGVIGKTAEGHCVPPSSIPNMRRLKIDPSRLIGFEETLSTTEKGNRAVAIVSAFMKAGRFPFWIEGEGITDKQIQITGTDILVSGKWTVEVKCDFRASEEYGKPHLRCTGNLYLQVAERNPLHRH
jgi:hypothetical protein